MSRTIRDRLETSASARATAALSLGAAGSVAIWENRDDRVRYGGHSGHVFSLYLEGGTGTRRTDGRFGHGRPGAVCILPEGQSSEWDITTPFRFVHLYVSAAQLHADFARIHGCDARRLDLPELTFAERPRLAAALARLAVAAQGGGGGGLGAGALRSAGECPGRGPFARGDRGGKPAAGRAEGAVDSPCLTGPPRLQAGRLSAAAVPSPQPCLMKVPLFNSRRA